MKKFILLGVGALSLMLLVSCGSSSAKNNSRETSIQSSQSTKTSKQIFHGVNFYTPASWNKKAGDENTEYFYPKDGQLEVRFDSTLTFTSDTSAVFLAAMSKSLDNFKVGKQITRGDHPDIFEWDISFSNKNDQYKGQLAVFNVNGGSMMFMIASTGNTYDTYKGDFDTVLGSLDYAQPSDSSVSNSNSSDTVSDSSSEWNLSTKTLTTSDGILKIDGIEKTTDFQGAPALKVNFTLTNKEATAQNAQLLLGEMMRVQQVSTNTSNDLELAILNDTSDNLQDNINPNGTISGFYPVSLENQTDPIAIQLQDNYQNVATYQISLH